MSRSNPRLTMPFSVKDTGVVSIGSMTRVTSHIRHMDDMTEKVTMLPITRPVKSLPPGAWLKPVTFGPLVSGIIFQHPAS